MQENWAHWRSSEGAFVIGSSGPFLGFPNESRFGLSWHADPFIVICNPHFMDEKIEQIQPPMDYSENCMFTTADQNDQVSRHGL